MMGWIDTKRPPTFSVDGLDNDMDFQALRREWSVPADGFRCKVRWDSCYGSAREALPCSEQRDAKQPGHSNVRAVCLAERTRTGFTLYRSAPFGNAESVFLTQTIRSTEKNSTGYQKLTSITYKHNTKL
jgi:hypothetical protein